MSRVRVLLVLTGVIAIAYAAFGVIADPGVLLFLAVVLVVHDAVWMPLVFLAGALITRLLPGRHRRPVRVALLIAAAVVVVGAPLALSPGRPADNPSVLPLPYGRNIALVLTGIGAVTALSIAVRRRKESERRRPRRSDPADG